MLAKFLSKVGYREADIGVAYFACSHARSTMVDCSQALDYGHLHWITRAPREILPLWNLLGIFDKPSWVAIFITMVTMSVFLWFAAKVGASYGLEYHYGKVPLFPVR